MKIFWYFQHKLIYFLVVLSFSAVFWVFGFLNLGQKTYATLDTSTMAAEADNSISDQNIDDRVDNLITNISNVDVMHLPQLDNFVVDFSNTLDNSQIASLNQKASDYEKSTSNEFATVIIPDRQGNELYDITLDIFRNNKIWKDTDNNGLLLVISPNEKKIRIMVWYGLEGDIPDVLVKQVIEQDLRPSLNSGDIYKTISDYIDIFSKILVDNDYKAKYLVNKSTNEIMNPNIINLFMICLFFGLFSGIFAGIVAPVKEDKKLTKAQNIISNVLFFLMILIFVSVLFRLSYMLVAGIGYLVGAVFGMFMSSAGSNMTKGDGGWWSSWGWGGGWRSGWWWRGGGGWFGWFGGWSTWGGGAGD